MKILIARLSALGDAALTLPLFFRLRKFFPKAGIGWVIEERNAGLLESVSGLDCVHLLRRKDKNARGFWRLSREIKKENYDVALDAQGLTKSAALPWLAGIRRRIGFRRYPLEAREIAPLLNNELVSPPAETTHIALRTNRLAEPLGVPDGFQAPVTLAPPPEDSRVIADWRKTTTAGRPLLLVGIGSSWETKIWPPEYIAGLLAHAVRCGWQPVIAWGPAEAGKIVVWRKIFGTNAEFSPATRSIAQLIALLSHAGAYIGPDSAALHLAWLLGKPTFSWFGPSSAPRGAPPDTDSGTRHRHVVAFPPNRRRRGEMMWCLKPETVLSKFAEWLARTGTQVRPENKTNPQL
jgi:ADP-heptose:LPS heptosyltransferase